MTPALNHYQQGAAQRRGGEPRKRRYIAAPSVVDNQFQSSVLPGRPPRRDLPHRGNCRRLQRAPAFFFTYRNCTRTGLQSLYVAAMQACLDQPEAQLAVGPQFHSSSRLSSSVSVAMTNRDREAEGSVPNRRGEFPKGRGAFQHEFG